MVVPLMVRPGIRCSDEANCRNCDQGDPKIFKNHKLFLQRLSENKTGADKRFPKEITGGVVEGSRGAAPIISEYLSRDRAMPNNTAPIELPCWTTRTWLAPLNGWRKGRECRAMKMKDSN
jgi:hypothetical protein